MHHDTRILFSASTLLLSRPLLFAVFLCSLPVSGIELYRCSHDGEVEFRQTPCPEGVQTLTEVTEQSRGMTPVKPALRLPERQQVSSRQSQGPDKPGNEERCWKTRLRLEKVERRLRGGYRASQYEALHRKQDEYAGYLRRFCRD